MRNAVGAVTAFAVAALATISPAAAEPTATSVICDNGSFCIWQEPEFGGAALQFSRPAPSVDIRVGSVWNSDNVDWCIYAGQRYTGQYLRFRVDHVAARTNFPTRSLRPC
jgi:hypothetical protein